MSGIRMTRVLKVIGAGVVGVGTAGVTIPWAMDLAKNWLAAHQPPTITSACYSPFFNRRCDPQERVPLLVGGFSRSKETELDCSPVDRADGLQINAEFTWVPAPFIDVSASAGCSTYKVNLRQGERSAETVIKFEQRFLLHLKVPAFRASISSRYSSHEQVLQPRNYAMFFRLACDNRSKKNAAVLETYWGDVVNIDYDSRRVSIIREGIHMVTEVNSQFKDIANDLLGKYDTVFFASQEEFGFRGKLNQHPTVLFGTMSADGVAHEMVRFSCPSGVKRQARNMTRISSNPKIVLFGGVQLVGASLTSPIDFY